MRAGPPGTAPVQPAATAMTVAAATIVTAARAELNARLMSVEPPFITC